MASVVFAVVLLMLESAVSQNCYPQGPCDSGYMDRTDGESNNWACGSGCVGGAYRTRSDCSCACIPEGPCTTTTPPSYVTIDNLIHATWT